MNFYSSQLLRGGFPAKNLAALRKSIRYLQIDIRNYLFISQFVDSKFLDLLLCWCHWTYWQKSKTWKISARNCAL